MGMALAWMGTSAAPPGSILMLAFHFLAVPAPQWCSQWVGWYSRFSGGCCMQAAQQQTTLTPSMTNRPRIPPQLTIT
ncbi:hypothetical protein V8C86DRAFT_2610701 [Haematococcus lacustris]